MSHNLQVDVCLAGYTGHDRFSRSNQTVVVPDTLHLGPWTYIALVGIPVSIIQAEALITWINETAPGEFKYIYTTYANEDHYLGSPVIMKHFPAAPSVGTV
ncbi:metallo-beta-lactamase superfamily protein [Penicillium fimorum]|uniref:Metallo-beta-lactamase superfamily protein n=1 Tax=Penicillium fimorum TaxID=1882269 RepID=A0A9W9Y3D1_9EURO|nr:metallo-beta-lactamase superfamily protein [Penicillium fimorum]